MNWPLVTRIRFEYEQRHTKLLQVMLSESGEEMKELRQEFIGLVAGQQDRVDELVKTIVEMKREGFEPTPEIIELVPEKDLPAAIWEAINEVSAKGTREFYTNMAHAHEAIGAAVPEETIIRQILYGQEVDV